MEDRIFIAVAMFVSCLVGYWLGRAREQRDGEAAREARHLEMVLEDRAKVLERLRVFSEDSTKILLRLDRYVALDESKARQDRIANFDPGAALRR